MTRKIQCPWLMHGTAEPAEGCRCVRTMQSKKQEEEGFYFEARHLVGTLEGCREE